VSGGQVIFEFHALIADERDISLLTGKVVSVLGAGDVGGGFIPTRIKFTIRRPGRFGIRCLLFRKSV
jgi:hypothetical protein